MLPRRNETKRDTAALHPPAPSPTIGRPFCQCKAGGQQTVWHANATGLATCRQRMPQVAPRLIVNMNVNIDANTYHPATSPATAAAVRKISRGFNATNGENGPSLVEQWKG